MKLKQVTNIAMEQKEENAEVRIKIRSTDSQRAHAVKIAVNQLVKLAGENDIPIFIAYYDPRRGYQYNGLFPEEIEAPDVADQYGRFMEFLKICISFNRDDNTPTITKKEDH